jgi:hypothetical protein
MGKRLAEIVVGERFKSEDIAVCVFVIGAGNPVISITGVIGDGAALVGDLN